MGKLFIIILLVSLLFALGCAKPKDGEKGEPGANGSNGTVVTIVQFCPGNSQYPTTFPEVGMCINNRIYAVFWMNNSSYMAEVVPGNYHSTSTSLPCNFTVVSGCNISN